MGRQVFLVQILFQHSRHCLRGDSVVLRHRHLVILGQGHGQGMVHLQPAKRITGQTESILYTIKVQTIRFFQERTIRDSCEVMKQTWLHKWLRAEGIYYHIFRAGNVPDFKVICQS